MDYNLSGSLLAIASSYIWDLGNIEHPNDRLFIFELYNDFFV